MPIRNLVQESRHTGIVLAPISCTLRLPIWKLTEVPQGKHCSYPFLQDNKIDFLDVASVSCAWICVIHNFSKISFLVAKQTKLSGFEADCFSFWGIKTAMSRYEGHRRSISVWNGKGKNAFYFILWLWSFVWRRSVNFGDLQKIRCLIFWKLAYFIQKCPANHRTTRLEQKIMTTDVQVFSNC